MPILPDPGSDAPRLPAEAVELRDGSRIRIRPVQPDDKGPIAEGFERMSPKSRYRRFFAPLEQLSDTDLRYLTEIDHHDHEALVAFDAESGDPVGVARYVRGADPAYAEVAVAVVDDWQGRGAATALLERLVERARAAGLTHFVALVMSDNTEARQLFEHLAEGEAAPRRSDSGHLELLIELPGPGREVRGSKLGRALRTAAGGTVRMNPWSALKRTIGNRR